MSGGIIIIPFLALSWVYWHVTRWLAPKLGWIDPMDGAIGGVALVTAAATLAVLVIGLRWKRTP